MDNLINSPIDKELSKLSPFELKGRIIEMANEKVKKAANTLLNAGRGNPNWVAAESRNAFFALGQFAMSECNRDFSLPEGIAGVPQKNGIAMRFEAWIKSTPLHREWISCAEPTNTASRNSPSTLTLSSRNGPAESSGTTTPPPRAY